LVSKLPPDLISRIGLILNARDNSTSLDDVNRPSFRLRQLKGDRKGQWAVTVRANWRIVFGFDGRDITGVDIEDYH